MRRAFSVAIALVQDAFIKNIRQLLKDDHGKRRLNRKFEGPGEVSGAEAGAVLYGEDPEPVTNSGYTGNHQKHDIASDKVTAVELSNRSLLTLLRRRGIGLSLAATREDLVKMTDESGGVKLQPGAVPFYG